MFWETAAQIVTTIVTPIAVIAAVFAGWVAWRQVKHLRAIEEIKLALEFKKFFGKFQNIHRKFMPDGKYQNAKSRIDEADWAEIYGYLGAFEMLYRSIQNKTFSEDFALNQYCYRLINIWSNLEVQNVIAGQIDDWKDLACLMRQWSIRSDFKQILPIKSEPSKKHNVRRKK